MADPEQSDVAALTVQLLSAYLANNTVAHTDIADLVRATKAALIEEKVPAPVEPEAPAHVPAVTTRKSLASPDHILSLIDGKPYKTLKRHLAKHGLTPASYRERYGLAASYPMVAPAFAAERRAIAEKIGLGRRSKVAPTTAELDASPPSSEAVETLPSDAEVSVSLARKKAAPARKAAAKAATAPSTQQAAPKKRRTAAATKAQAVAPDAIEAEPAQVGEVAARPRNVRSTLKLFEPKKEAAKAVKPKPKPARGKGRAETAPVPGVDGGSDTPDL